MPEALARSNHDFKLSRRTAQATRRRGVLRSVGGLLLRQLSARPATTVAGAAFAALMTGIALNGLVLQTARHPAPLFGAARPPAAPAAAPRIPAAPAVAHASPAAVPPAMTPAVAVPPRPAAVASAPAGSPGADPIAQLLDTGAVPRAPAAAGDDGDSAPAPRAESITQFLKGGSSSASEGAASREKTVFAAQRALAKLGYGIKANGVFGPATRQAIERFEREHKLPVKPELTPHLMHALASAAAAPAR